jgi:hypothetical protein
MCGRRWRLAMVCGAIGIAVAWFPALARERNQPRRAVEGQVLVSTQLPRIRIEIAPEFRFVGRLPFRIRDVAEGERLVFAETGGTRVTRLFVAQFEGFLPGVEDIYRYSFENARRFGSHRFRHNVFAYVRADADEENPAGEAALTHRFLADRGLELPNVLLVSRFLTLGDDRRRNELILFYMEAGTKHQYDAIDSGSAAGKDLARALEERSLTSFRVIE